MRLCASHSSYSSCSTPQQSSLLRPQGFRNLETVYGTRSPAAYGRESGFRWGMAILPVCFLLSVTTNVNLVCDVNGSVLQRWSLEIPRKRLRNSISNPYGLVARSPTRYAAHVLL